MSATLQPKFAPAVISPTEEQLAIQLSRGRVVIVEANAGAAKTTTLCLRIGEAIANGVPPESILALTFTEEARNVLRGHLHKLGVARNTVKRIQIKTFDELSQSILYELRDGSVRLFESAEDLRPYALQALEQVSRKYAHDNQDLEVVTHNLAVDQFLKIQVSIKARMLVENLPDDISPSDVADFLGVSPTHFLWFEEYERIRLGLFEEVKFRGPLDATYDLARYLRSDMIVGEALPEFRHIVCDELHDMNESAFLILIALIRRGNSRFVGAGDSDQVIHGEKGADAEFVRSRFDGEFPRYVERLKLTASYRFGPLLAMAMEKFKKKPVVSKRGFDTTVVRVGYKADEWGDCGQKSALAAKSWSQAHGVRSSNAILIRDIHQSIPIEVALMDLGLSYRCEGMKSFFERTEILFLRGVLAIALSNYEALDSEELMRSSLEAIVALGEIDFGNAASDGYQAAPFKTQKAAQRDMVSAVLMNRQLLNDFYTVYVESGKSQAQFRLAAAIQYLRQSSSDLSAGDALRAIVEHTKLKLSISRLVVSRADAAVVERSVDAFVELADHSKLNGNQFLQHIRTLEVASRARQGKAGDIVLSRVMTSKGNEHDHVVLPFMEVGEFPSATAVLTEEENLFYVGVTRARNQLTLVVPDEPNRVSDFVKRMALPKITPLARGAIEKSLNEETASAVTDLNVPFEAKDQAKALGARWDPVRKTWYVAAGIDMTPFKIWRKKSEPLG